MIETSGLAEVPPVVYAFNEPELLETTDVDSIICVIDAENYQDNMKRNRTALEQLQCADIVLLNKVDLVDRNQVDEVKKDVKEKVPEAQIIETTKGQAELKLLLGVGKFNPAAQAEWKRDEHKHAHDPDIQAVSCSAGPIDSDKVQEVLENLPENIFRAKGILCIKESQPSAKDELRIIWNKVGKRTEMEFTRPWQEGEKKETKIVFIGNKLHPKELQEKLDSCV
jgi:G3E family GTPase